MDAEAIKKLQDSTVAKALANSLADESQAIALPDATRIHELEHLYPQRRRYRGTFSTQLTSAFAAYTAARDADIIRQVTPPRVFINPDTMTAQAIFNMGDSTSPGHCDDTAALKLQPTAAFTALRQLQGRMDQRKAAEWMEDWRENLSAIDADGNAIASTNKAIAAIRRIKIDARSEAEHSTGQMSQGRSLMESVEAKSSEGLPHWLIFSCIPYHGLSQRDFHIRVGVANSDGQCTVLLQVVQMEQAEEQMQNEFAAILAGELPAGITPLIGTFKP